MVNLVGLVERNPAAVVERLLREFGRVGHVLAASPARLRHVLGSDSSVVDLLVSTQETIGHALHCNFSSRPVLASSQALTDYLLIDMGFSINERLRVLHLNGRNLLICDEVMREGTIDTVDFYVREIIRRALELGSAAIIVVHNHPSGSPEPSSADISVTRRLANGCAAVNLDLHDHIIVAAEGITSFRALGLL